jgi:hypothetical protein
MPRIIFARSADTTAEAERIQIELLRAAPVPRRLHLAFSLTASVISAARRALVRTHPDASPRELDLLFVKLHYGSALADDLRVDLNRRDRTARREA